MYQNDWILRQIEMLGAAFARIVKALREGRTEEALDLTDEAMAETLGIDPALAETLDAPSLTMLVTMGPDGARRAFLAGELLTARTLALTAAGRREDAAREGERARALLLAARPDAGEGASERIGELLGWLDDPDEHDGA
ncbi:MAG: hypothetical protein Kow0067_11470 [Coriobacteriia bacterium]